MTTDSDGKYTSTLPIAPLTTGPKHHYFGYYDKFSENLSGRYVLSHETTFWDRPPRGDDRIPLGMIDLKEANRFQTVAETSAWSWQQGAMLQWWPGEPESTIVYNDRGGDEFVSVVQDIRTGSRRVLPRPVAAVNRTGKKALSLNFSRLADLRPGYGYAELPDKFADVKSPADDGIYLLDMQTGKYDLIISVAQMTALNPEPTMAGAMHWFNHFLFSPDDKRFIFLHRWFQKQGEGVYWFTRLYTANVDGTGIRCLNNQKMTSHFDWADESHVIAWANQDGIGNRYYLFSDDGSGKAEIIGDTELTPFGDGHCSYSPDRKWILTDTYPDKEKHRTLLLFNVEKKRRITLGRFFSVPTITEIRCDLHPRWMRDGKGITLDSSHTGVRQIYGMDLTSIVGE